MQASGITLRGLILLSSMGGTVLYSQEKPSAPDRSVDVEQASVDTAARKQLPKLTLPEFDITGKEAVQIGANAKDAAEGKWLARPTTIAEGTGQKEDRLSTLGESRMAGLPAGAGGFTGRVEAGIGSFASPRLDLRLGTTASDFGFLLKTGYESSAGHLTNGEYRNGHASLAASYLVGPGAALPGTVTATGEFGIRGRMYRLYGSSTPALERTVDQLHLAGSIQSEMAGGFSYSAGVSFRDISVSDDEESDDTGLDVRIAAGKQWGRTSTSGLVEWWNDSYASPSTGQNPFLAGFRGEVRHRISDRIEIHGGLSMYSVRASFGESSFRVYPLAGVSWSVEQWLTLAASYAPSVERSDLAGLFERYPYLRNDVHLAYPEYHTNVALSAGIEPARFLRGTATVRYQRARNLPSLIEGVSGTGEPEGIWDVAYSGTTRIFGLDAEIVVDLSSDISLGASAAWRETRNVSTGKQLPYAPSAELGGTYRHKLSFGLVVQSDLKVLGAQYVDPSNSETIPAYAVWDASAEYEIFPRLTLGVSVRNILEQDQERWRGYRGLPRTASLSGRYIW